MSDKFRKKSTVLGLLLSIFVVILAFGLVGYELMRENELSKGIIGLAIAALLMLFINWLNYSKFRKDQKSNPLKL